MPVTNESDFDEVTTGPQGEQLTLPAVLPQQDDRLTTIVAVAKRVTELIEEIANDQKALEIKQQNLDDLQLRQLPDLLRSVGVEELSLASGAKITTKTEYFASIPKGSTATFEWLRARNMGGIIKEEIVVDKSLKETLQAAEIPFTANETVHSSTLRAFVKEQMEAGSTLPPELFRVHTVERAVIR